MDGKVESMPGHFPRCLRMAALEMNRDKIAGEKIIRLVPEIKQILKDSNPEGAIGEDEVDEVAHAKLLKSIYALDGKKRFSNEVRGAGLSSNNLDLLVHTKKESSKITHKDLSVKNQQNKLVAKPLSSLETEKAKRQIARDVMAKDTKKWEPIVNEIRMAPQTRFSDRPVGIKMYKAMQPQKFSPRTPLELELYEALGKSDDIITPDEPLTKAETDALKAMSVKEARARREELMRHHELLSRMQVKAKRIKKIKSKRYRKLLRKDKESEAKKKLEEMRLNDPEAFLEKMEEMDRARMKERASLKHKAGGKFARYHKAYSKYDDKTREAVQEMIRKGKELTKKRHVESSDEEEEEEMQAEADLSKGSSAGNANHEDKGTANSCDLNASHLEVMKAVLKKAGGWLDSPTKYVYQSKSEDASSTSQTKDSTEAVKEDSENIVEEEAKSREEAAVEDETSKKRKRQDSDRVTDEAKTEISAENVQSSPVKELPKKKRKNQDEEEKETMTEQEQQIVDQNEGGGTGKRKKKNIQDEEEKEVKNETPKKKQKIIVETEDGPLTKSGKKKKAKKISSEDSSSPKVEEKDEKSGEKNTKEVEEIVLKPSAQEALDEQERREEEGEREEGGDQMAVTMEELFEDEDVVEQFARDKEEEEEKRRPKVEDTRLPGWGSWSGPDYKEVEKRRVEKVQRRRKFERRGNTEKKEDKQPNVWLNPNRDENIRKLQPKKVPFPYTSAEQYAAACRQPVSRGFVREVAHKILIKPEVVTKLGHIIKPLDKDDFFKNKDSLADPEGMGEDVKYTGPINFRKQDNRLKSLK